MIIKRAWNYKDSYIIRTKSLHKFDSDFLNTLYEVSALTYVVDLNNSIILNRCVVSSKDVKILNSKGFTISHLKNALEKHIRPIVDDIIMIRHLVTGNIIFGNTNLVRELEDLFKYNQITLIEYLLEHGTEGD